MTGLDPEVFNAMREDLRAHLTGLVDAATLRLFGPPPKYPPKVSFVARGICGWCAQPFMRRMEHPKGTEHAPVLYCSAGHGSRASRRRNQIAANAARCPNPHKRVFLTEAVAEAEAAQYSSSHSTGRAPLRVYRCDPGCGGWHITKARQQRPALTGSRTSS